MASHQDAAQAIGKTSDGYRWIISEDRFLDKIYIHLNDGKIQWSPEIQQFKGALADQVVRKVLYYNFQFKKALGWLKTGLF
jgi:restriction endonuclease Mrr